ncbi:MAG: hypothetical protein FDX30_06455 [Chlorobium sp.]|nr:MAG: hypothetical protein FDX30_06455 [Chlorobium sp.]
MDDKLINLSNEINSIGRIELLAEKIVLYPGQSLVLKMKRPRKKNISGFNDLKIELEKLKIHIEGECCVYNKVFEIDKNSDNLSIFLPIDIPLGNYFVKLVYKEVILDEISFFIGCDNEVVRLNYYSDALNSQIRIKRFLSKNEYQKSYDLFLYTCECFEKSNCLECAFDFSKYVSDVFYDAKEYSYAIKALEKTLSIATKLNDNFNIRKLNALLIRVKNENNVLENKEFKENPHEVKIIRFGKVEAKNLYSGLGRKGFKQYAFQKAFVKLVEDTDKKADIKEITIFYNSISANISREKIRAKTTRNNLNRKKVKDDLIKCNERSKKYEESLVTFSES